MRIPANGKQLLQARQAGKRPAGGVAVVTDWDIAKDWPCRLVADTADEDYDFRMVYGLQVFLFHGEYTGQVSKLAMDVLKCEPECLFVIDHENYTGMMYGGTE